MRIRGKLSMYAAAATALAVALAGSVVAFAGAADKDKGNGNTSEVKFAAGAKLVLVPTLVTDKSGNHISGLKQEDFTVLENGAEQKIATFEEITSDPHRLSRPKNPNEFNNALAGGASARRVTLIVLDLINTPFLDQANARKELLKYLTQSVDQREPTGLYTLTRSGVQVVHDFTSDPRILVAALHVVRGDSYEMVDSDETTEAITGTASPDGNSGAPSGASSKSSGSSKGNSQAAVQGEAQKLQSMMEDSELNFKSFEQRLAITYTLDGLQTVAQALAGVPGRKSLIWASGGFPFNVSDNTMQLAPAGRDTLADVLPLYERTWQLLNDAEISLYPVDVKGLQVVSMPSASLRNPGKNYSRHMQNRQFDTQSSFLTFASMTGGRAYFGSNDLEKGFREAVNDSAEYYMLGYYIDRAQTKPGWRKLTVKANREHVEVRARSGFFVTNATIDPESGRNNDISSALQSPLDYTSLALVARWNKIEPGKEPGKKHVTYEMRLAPDAGVINDADNNHVALDFVAMAKTPEGKAVDHPIGQKVDIHLTPERLSAIRQQGLVYRDALDLAPGEYTVRFVVRDDLSGRTGSVAAPLKVE
ncbi:MAG: VWA domain-containing protein [Candidatus Sulfotelmatobacter sp.]